MDACEALALAYDLDGWTEAGGRILFTADGRRRSAIHTRSPKRAAPAGQPGWRIVFKPHGRMYGSANEAGLLLREVGRLGPITVSVDEAALPTWTCWSPKTAI